MIDSKPVVLKKKLTMAELVKRGAAESVRNVAGGTNKVATTGPSLRKIENEEVKLPTVTSDIASQIIKARNNKGLKQADLAKLINVPAAVIQSYENKKGIPDSNILMKISKALDINPPLKKPKAVKQPKFTDLDQN